MAFYLQRFFRAMADINGIGVMKSLRKSYVIIISGLCVGFSGLGRKPFNNIVWYYSYTLVGNNSQLMFYFADSVASFLIVFGYLVLMLAVLIFSELRRATRKTVQDSLESSQRSKNSRYT
jgi:hypothetical protein